MKHENPSGQGSMMAVLLSGAPMPAPAPGTVREHRMDETPASSRASQSLGAAKNAAKPQDFSAADKALIRKVHGYMSVMQLLGILNERLVADQGAKATLFTVDQLKAEIAGVSTAVPNTGNDWGALRKLLAKARRDGVLEQINEQVINDFAVVYALNQKQVMTLKDVLLNQEEQ